MSRWLELRLEALPGTAYHQVVQAGHPLAPLAMRRHEVRAVRHGPCGLREVGELSGVEMEMIELLMMRQAAGLMVVNSGG